MLVGTSKLKVPLRREITSSAIEEALSSYYAKSCDAKKTKITFDLRPCTWCEVFALSVLSLWIWELTAAGKQVYVLFPRDPDLQRFFISYCFDEFLKANHVSVEQQELQGVYARTRQTLAPSYPLTFVSELSFRNLLAELKDPNRIKVLLSGMDTAEIVRSGALRNVVLKELGDNVFLHGEGKAGHVVMTKISRLVVHKPQRRSSAFEEMIYQSIKGLADRSVLEIALGDKGPGIPKTLHSAYARAKNHEGDVAFSECDVIEYAFQYFTSRRSAEERLGEFLGHFLKDLPPPPTGLHQLRELVRSHRGVLCVRSGAAFVAFDFTQTDTPRTIRSDRANLPNPLCTFGGAQYRILIPTDRLNDDESSDDLKAFQLFTSATNNVEQELIAVTEFVEPKHYGNVKLEGKDVFALFDVVDGLGTKGTDGRRRSVVVDFESSDDMSSKTLYSILLGLCRRQSAENVFFAINVSHSGFSSLQDCPVEDMQRSQCLLVFDDRATPYLLGVSSKDPGTRLVKRRVALSSPQDSTRLSSIPREVIRSNIAKHILSPTSKVFRKDAKVLLLSGGYSHGYFEINRLFQDHQARSRIVRWFVFQFMETNPEVVVSLGTSMGDVVGSAIEAFRRQTGIAIQHVNLRTDNKGKVASPRLLLVEPGTRVVVAGDVVGSSRSMRATIRKLRHTTIQRVIAIVDAQQEPDLHSELPALPLELASIVHKPLRYPSDLPNDWLYHEIYQVDPDTHSLVKEIVRPLGPIWIEHATDVKLEGKSEFLEQVVLPLNAFFSGHFVTGKKHMSYLFDIPVIVDNHETDIVTAITEDIRKAEMTRTLAERKPIEYVIFPQFNRGLDRVAKKVASRYSNATTLAIQEAQLRTIFDQQSSELRDKCVAVVDDATDSGDTVVRLIDIAERMGATRIYGYVLINRGPAYSVRRLEKLKQYGAASTHIRYLAEAQVPSYVSENCPICRRRQRLTELAKEMGAESKFARYISEVADSLAEQSASAIGQSIEPSSNFAYQTTTRKQLALRCLLAEAEAYLELRHGLTETLKAYKDDPQTAISLLCVMANESILPSNPLYRTSQMFYSSFVDGVRTISKAIADGQMSSMTADELGAALTVADSFQDWFALENAEKLLLQNLSADEHLFRVTLWLLESPSCQQNPAVMASAYAALSESVPVNAPAIQHLCDEIKQYWQGVSKERSGQSSLRLTAYRALLGGRSHDLDHQYRDLLMKIEERMDDLQEDWKAYRSNLVDMSSCLRLVISSSVSADLCAELEKKSTRLMRRVRDMDQLVASRSGPESSVDEEFRNLLKEGAYETKAIWAEIGQDLTKLRTNVKESVLVVLENCQVDLNAKKIKWTRHLPEEACLVFGESSDVRLALNNLVDNVVSWSQARNLLIEIALEEDEKFVRIKMLDDGVGVPDLLSGIGLSRVREIATALFGRFKLSKVPEGSLYHERGFRTSAELSLPSVPVRGNAA